MDHAAVQQVNQEIYRKYPEFNGIKPDIQSSPTAKTASQNGGYLLTYQVQVVAANDRRITRWLRVNVSAQGKILKVSTSR
jgi:hypothetical protein